MPGAIVTLTNTATSQTQSATTDLKGLYGFSLLPPGTYEVDFSAKGFKLSQAAMVVVNVSEAPSLNARLEAGSSEDRVICQCQFTQSASSSGTLVDRKTITAVPLTTRNFTQVLSMSSGSAGAVNNAALLGTGSQTVNVNGNTAAGTYTVDGAISANTVPNPDTISEFKIQTSQYDAGYGARVPNTNLITRSGENDLHGTLWEFVRNDIFNANSFFQNANRQPKPNLKQNQFGGTIGGAIKKDRVFFFGSYQGTRQTNGLDPSSLATMLLPALTNDRSAAKIGSEFCPSNNGPAGAPNNPFYTFAGGILGQGVQVACDGSNINPVALKILQASLPDGTFVIPTPQHIASGSSSGFAYQLGQSSFSLPSTYRENHYLSNLDYLISKKHTLAGRFYYANSGTLRALGGSIFTSAATPNVPGFPQNSTGTDYMASAKLTSVLTSNLVNEARMTFTRTYSFSSGPHDLTTAAIGMTSVDPLLPVAPDMTIQGFLGGFRVGNAQNQASQLNKPYSFADNLSWNRGRHTIRSGILILAQSQVLYDTGPARGKITFQNFTDFLLGMSAAQNGSPTGLSNIQSIDAKEGPGPNGEIIYGNRTNYGSVFIADDLKIYSRLTLNFGLRWEYLPAASDITGDQGNSWSSLLNLAPIPPVAGTYIGVTIPANFDPNQINPYTSKPFGTPPPGVLVRPDSGFYQNKAPLRNFAPRFGFAWQPGGQQSRLTLRGGYGWFYQTTADRGNAPGFPLVNMQPFAQLSQNAGASNGTSTLQKPFPTTTLGYVLRTPATRLTDRVLGSMYQIPKLQQWNLNVQFGVSQSFSLDLGYVGSYASNLLLGYGSNQPQLGSAGHPVNCGLPTNAAAFGVDATTFAGFGVDSSGCVATNTAGNAFLRAPIIGETPTALVASRYIGASWYHSMQATIRKQVSHGLLFQVAYTFSKSLANTTVDNDQTNLGLDWARTSFDRTHRLIANLSYDLPGIRASGFTGALLNGWSTTGIIIIQSGLPMTLTDRSGGSVYGFAGTSTVTLCPGATYKELATSGSIDSRLNNWINKPAVCSAPILGSDGKATGYGNAGQSIMNGPGQFNTDFSLGKTTTVGGMRENAQLAFRVEFYNALNHPQFNNPGTVFGTSNFGVINQTSVGPRLIQFGVKYIF